MSGKNQLENAFCLQMFVQSAEVRLLGVLPRPELDLSCELSNIARGTCALRLVPVDIAPRQHIGHVDIAAGKPQMRAEIQLSHKSFETVLHHLRVTPPRPIAIVVALAEPLQTSDHGDLHQPFATRVDVIDLSWNIPLL